MTFVPPSRLQRWAAWPLAVLFGAITRLLPAEWWMVDGRRGRFWVWVHMNALHWNEH